MLKIEEFPITEDHCQIINPLIGSKIVSAGMNHRGFPCVWVHSDDDQVTKERIGITVVLTGSQVSAGRHIGSFPTNKGTMHVYSLQPEDRP